MVVEVMEVCWMHGSMYARYCVQVIPSCPFLLRRPDTLIVVTCAGGYRCTSSKYLAPGTTSSVASHKLRVRRGFGA